MGEVACVCFRGHLSWSSHDRSDPVSIPTACPPEHQTLRGVSCCSNGALKSLGSGPHFTAAKFQARMQRSQGCLWGCWSCPDGSPGCPVKHEFQRSNMRRITPRKVHSVSEIPSHWVTWTCWVGAGRREAQGETVPTPLPSDGEMEAQSRRQPPRALVGSFFLL